MIDLSAPLDKHPYRGKGVSVLYRDSVAWLGHG